MKLTIKGIYKSESCGDGCCSWSSGELVVKKDDQVIVEKAYDETCPYYNENTLKEYIIQYFDAYELDRYNLTKKEIENAEIIFEEAYDDDFYI